MILVLKNGSEYEIDSLNYSTRNNGRSEYTISMPCGKYPSKKLDLIREEFTADNLSSVLVTEEDQEPLEFSFTELVYVSFQLTASTRSITISVA